MHVIFRAETGTSVGMGHLVRCSKLAHSFDLDNKPVLITRESDSLASALDTMPSNFWEVKPLSAEASIEEDAEITSEIYRSSKADFLLTDLCHAENIQNQIDLLRYHRKLYDNNISKIIAISDYRISNLQVDLTIIPYECPKIMSNELDKISNLLYGLDYFISDPELTNIRSDHAVAETASKVFVCIGGTDPTEITPVVLRALAAIKQADLDVKVVLNAAMPKTTINQIMEVCGEQENFHSIPFSDDFLESAAWADIAITGEGLIKYETAAIGTPTLMITQFDHDSDVILRFIEKGATEYLGRADRLTQNDMTKSIHDILKDQKLRTSLVKRGTNLIDGKGLSRINQRISEVL